MTDARTSLYFQGIPGIVYISGGAIRRNAKCRTSRRSPAASARLARRVRSAKSGSSAPAASAPAPSRRRAAGSSPSCSGFRTDPRLRRSHPSATAHLRPSPSRCTPTATRPPPSSSAPGNTSKSHSLSSPDGHISCPMGGKFSSPSSAKRYT